MINKKQKALFYVAKAKTGMTDTEKADLLAGVGVTSVTELTQAKFDLIMQRFVELGFKARNGKARSSKLKAENKRRLNVRADKKRMMAKLGAILADLGLPWAYVDKIAKSRYQVEVVGWCDAHHLYEIVQMMAVHQARQQVKANYQERKR
jgi:Bacteriophage Mu, GemA protein